LGTLYHVRLNPKPLDWSERPFAEAEHTAPCEKNNSTQWLTPNQCVRPSHEEDICLHGSTRVDRK
jgi:hypothetical protein